ncbi:MAG TPA: hypothetical protein VK395_17150 [Gemmataceae bacterium]|nr:hypothetical protein [Gemmataceae bacterium]
MVEFVAQPGPLLALPEQQELQSGAGSSILRTGREGVADAIIIRPERGQACSIRRKPTRVATTKPPNSAIAGYEAAGHDDVKLADLLANVAWRRYFIGRYVEAEPLYLRALAMQPRNCNGARRNDVAAASLVGCPSCRSSRSQVDRYSAPGGA